MVRLPGTERQEAGARFPHIRLLGVRIDCLRLVDLLVEVRRAVQQTRSITVLYVNVHCMNVSRKEPDYAKILEAADIVYCDGTGVRLGARIAGLAIPERMTGADWIHDLARLSVRDGLALFLLGSEEGVAAEAASALQVRYPGLRIVGTEPGYGLDAQTIERINAAKPDILLVGMGTPTQERWIAAHRAHLDVPVVWAVGALFEFVAGRIWRGPPWLTEHGLEWLCRLVVEPRKLWRRYLVGNPLFVSRVIRTYWLHRYVRRRVH